MERAVSKAGQRRVDFATSLGGLWYPVAGAAMSLVTGALFPKETLGNELD